MQRLGVIGIAGYFLLPLLQLLDGSAIQMAQRQVHASSTALLINFQADLGVPGLRERLSALVEDAIRTISDRDPGGMHLDARKGLVGDDSVRRRPRRAKGLRVVDGSDR